MSEKVFFLMKTQVMVLDPQKIRNATSEAYHKAKADGSNPELVKAVEELLGKPKAVTPNVEDWSKDVDSTTKALEELMKGRKNDLKNKQKGQSHLRNILMMQLSR